MQRHERKDEAAASLLQPIFHSVTSYYTHLLAERVLEIVGREANGSCGCAPVGCGMALVGQPLNAGCWSGWTVAAGQ